MGNKTCYEMLIEGVDLKKGNIIFNDHKISLKTFLKNIEDFSISLKALGFNKGDVLTIYLPTCPQALVAFYACSKLGVVANIVHPLLPLDQLRENLKQTKSKGLMYYDILIRNHKDLASLNQILINCSISNYVIWRKVFFLLFAIYKCRTYKKAIKYSKLIKHNKNAKPTELEGRGDDVVCTMHSGGTSGQPKIIELQNSALNDLSIALEKMYTRKIRGGGSEYSLVALPIFHAYGLGVSVHTCLTNQYSLILVPNFKPKKFNAIIKKYNVTFFAGVPVMFKKMIEYKNFYGKHLAKLKDLWCGGDVLTESFMLLISVVLIVAFGFTAAKRGCTPVYALFCASISSMIWGGLNFLNNWKPKFSFFAIWGSNAILTYILTLVVSMLFGGLLETQMASLHPAAAVVIVLAILGLFTLMNWYLRKKNRYIRI